jgi:hypothetical protein
MHRLALFASLLAGCSAASDTRPDDTGPTPQAEPGLPDPQRLLDHVELLSSDACGGRLPGTAGGALAEDYLEQHFESLGLEGAGDDGGFRHHFPLASFQVTGPSELSIGGIDYQPGSDFELFSYSGAAEVEGELVFVGYGLTVPPFDAAQYPDCPLEPGGYDDYQGLDLQGAIAVVLRHGPADDWDIGDHCPANEAAQAEGDLFTFGYKAANAALHGAGAMLLFTDYQHPDAPAESGTLSEAYYDEDFPSLFVARRELEEQLPELEAWSAALDASLVPDPRATGVTGRVLTQTEVSSITVPNILAQIPGVDPEIGHEVVIVGGHFDHLGSDGSDVYYGADDNASGTAVVLELAQLFAEWGAAPARTVLFAGWNAEELGLVGSMYYVIEPTHPLEDTVALINLDMVGGGDELGLIDFGGSDEGSEELYELLASQQDDDFPVTPLESSPNSDHAWFQYAGVPVAFLFTTGAHAHYHTPEDRFDRISGEELEQTTRLSWDVLRILAMGEEQAVLEEAESETQALEAPVAPPVLPPLGLPVSW